MTADLTGKRFERLLVMRRDGSASNRAAWRCVCDCGQETRVVSSHLLRGNVKSCGCLKRAAKAHGAARRGKKSSEYLTWISIHQRCSNPKHRSYSDYGGRGIAVCARWHEFGAFFEDMGERPSPRHSIERRDNDGPYSPWNCEWATMKTQASNTRRNIVVDVRGETMTLMQAVERYRSREEYGRIAHHYRSGRPLDVLLGLGDA